jgi:hypothetical protein
MKFVALAPKLLINADHLDVLPVNTNRGVLIPGADLGMKTGDDFSVP